MTEKRQPQDPIAKLLDRVWKDDLAPFFEDRLRKQRQSLSRSSGTVASRLGSLLDRVFDLKGKPFSRSMAVLGAGLGAMIPDAWNWDWLAGISDKSTRTLIEDRVAQKCATLSVSEALSVFELPKSATETDVRSAWRAISKRWHPDLAPDEMSRDVYRLRFVAYRNAFEILMRHFEIGKESPSDKPLKKDDFFCRNG